VPEVMEKIRQLNGTERA